MLADNFDDHPYLYLSDRAEALARLSELNQEEGAA